MEVRTGLTGPFPRSEAVVAATRDFDRGRATAEQVEAAFAAQEAEVHAWEGRLGFSTRTAGYLRWPDLFRPLVGAWRGFSVGPLTRWFETNTFFRQPILETVPERIPGAFLAQLPPPIRNGDGGRARALLPGPYTLGGLLDNRSGETEGGLLFRLGRLLAEEVRELALAGVGVFQFQEPLLAARPPGGALAESLLAAYREIARVPGVTRIVWTAHGDLTGAAPLVRRLPEVVAGVDMAETEVDRLPDSWAGRPLGLGVLDPRTTLVESPAEIRHLVRTVVGRLRPPEVWLGPGAELDLLPPGPATAKLEALSAAAGGLASEERP